MLRTARTTASSSLFQRLSFLRGNWHLLALWPAVALLIAAIGWILLLAHLKSLEKTVEEEALRQAATSAVDYSEQLGRIAESVDEFSLYIRQAWNASGGAFRLEQWARSKAASNRWPFNVAIIGPDGDVISSRTQLPASVNLSGTEFFEVQKRAGQDFLYVSAPGISPLDNQEVVHFTRRLNGAHGAFAGAVMVCIPVARLTAGYNPAALGQYGFMGTVGTDGALRTEWVGEPALMNMPAGALAGSTRAASTGCA